MDKWVWRCRDCGGDTKGHFRRSQIALVRGKGLAGCITTVENKADKQRRELVKGIIRV